MSNAGENDSICRNQEWVHRAKQRLVVPLFKAARELPPFAYAMVMSDAKRQIAELEQQEEHENFVKHLEQASQIVGAWPEWKQKAIRAALSRKG